MQQTVSLKAEIALYLARPWFDANGQNVRQLERQNVRQSELGIAAEEVPLMMVYFGLRVLPKIGWL